MSALKVRREKEEELAKLEKSWAERLKKQEEKQKTVEKVGVEEFKKSVSSVEEMFKTSGKKEICREERQAVQDCYKSNAGKPLNCHDTVQAFKACVNNERLQTLQVHPGS